MSWGWIDSAMLMQDASTGLESEQQLSVAALVEAHIDIKVHGGTDACFVFIPKVLAKDLNKKICR
jgi:hypothetical protein